MEQRLEGRDLQREAAWSVAYDYLLAAAGDLRERALELAAMPLETFYRTALEHAVKRRKEHPEVNFEATAQYLLAVANSALDRIGIFRMPTLELAGLLHLHRVKKTAENV